MDVELLVIPGCPGAGEAADLLRVALQGVGRGRAGFSVVVVDSEEVAREWAFGGSPSFVVDGTDLFETTGTPGVLACRLYPTPGGPRNVPTPADLRRALQRRAGSADTTATSDGDG